VLTFVRLILLTCGASLCVLPLGAALPELSSIEPIEFDETAQRLVARGDARIDFQDIRISADRITYYQKFGLADATGNVAIMKESYRLVAETLNYRTEENIFSVDKFRTGLWPLYISGDNAGGTIEHTILEDIAIYYGEPNLLGPSIHSKKMEYLDQEEGLVKLGTTTFKLGKIPLMVLPGYTHKLKGSSPFFVNTAFGSRNELGTFFQTTLLFSATPWLRLGANLDGYTERGVLIGPAAQYSYNTETQTINGALSTGYINDQDESPNDINDNPIDPDRGFAEWRHRHRIGERINITATASYWSDSEVIRDFRQDYFRRNQQPDTFIEGVYAGDNYLFSAFGRFRPNNFQLIQERLPEVRFDLLPVPVLKTGAYQRFSASYAHLREDFGSIVPSITEESVSNRFDLTYRVERPTLIAEWLSFSPLIGARFTHYADQDLEPLVFNTFNFDSSAGSTSSTDSSATRQLYELGFDLEARAYATHSTINRTWAIDGLRHLLRPILSYRYIAGSEADDAIAPIDRTAFNLNRPLLNLSDLRNVDTLSDMHLARLGVENLFQTRAKDYGSRTLAALNFYQDILFERGTRFDGDPENALHASWLEFTMSPAPWLKFDVASRFNTADTALEELRSRVLLRSGEIWQIGLSSDFLRDRIDQFRIDFMYRINERISFLTNARYDLETNQFTRTEFALQTKLNNTWTLIYAIVFRQDAVREDDIAFSLRLNLTGL